MNTSAKSLIVLALALSASGCGLGKSEVVDLRATVSGPTTLTVGESHQYIAVVESTPAGGLAASPDRGFTVEWSSSNPAVATVIARDDILPGGIVRAPGGLVTASAPGQVVITATPRHAAKGVRGQATAGSLTITIVE